MVLSLLGGFCKFFLSACQFLPREEYKKRLSKPCLLVILKAFIYSSLYKRTEIQYISKKNPFKIQ